MMVRRLSCAVFALFLIQFWTFSALAIEKELNISDLLEEDYKFSSGFQYRDCESNLAGAAERVTEMLSAPIREFKRQSVPEKIKEIHIAVSLLRDLSYVEIRQGSPDLPEIYSDLKVEHGLILRLKFLNESSHKKLASHTREILMIAYKLLQMVAYAQKFYPHIQQELISFFNLVLELKSEVPLEKVDHDLRALAFGSLAILITARLIERNDPEQAFFEALQALLDGTREDSKGHSVGLTLEAALMVQQHVVAGVAAFSPIERDRVEQAMVMSLDGIKSISSVLAGKSLSDNRRLLAFLGQLTGLLRQPGMAHLPRFRVAVEMLRDQFQRPRDPKQIH